MSKKNSAPVSTQPAAGEVAVLETQTAAVATTDTGVSTEGVTVTPVVAPKAPAKAEISRGIMTSFYAAGTAKVDAEGNAIPDTDAVIYEATIAEMMRVNGYDRQLARGTYKANYLKAKVPAPVVTPKAPKVAATTEVAVVSTEVKTEEVAQDTDKVEDAVQS